MSTINRIVFMLMAGVLLATAGLAAGKEPAEKIRILVVSSYHREYAWSQDTQKGFCAAMLAFGYFDNKKQADEYTKNDSVETSRVIVKKMWMDATRKNTRAELEKSTVAIYKSAKAFHPDLIFLGDDEAGNYIGGLYLDTAVPVVFWGFNDNPVKYGLVDTASRPGHNVTGVYQSGYYVESLQLLKAIVPGVRTIAVLSDDTPSGRTHYKAIEYLARTGGLPLKLAETVATNDYELWKQKALELQKKVDAFYVVQYAGLKDRLGNHVPIKEVSNWYRAHIMIPEASRGHFVTEGLLCAADDSGYKQAFEAVSMAHDILSKGVNPATYPTRTATRGALIVNRARAKELGITLTPEMGIEEYIEDDVSVKGRADETR
jgi:ABC-type uncharacterized transport system substrate-binding protein